MRVMIEHSSDEESAARQQKKKFLSNSNVEPRFTWCAAIAFDLWNPKWLRRCLIKRKTLKRLLHARATGIRHEIKRALLLIMIYLWHEAARVDNTNWWRPRVSSLFLPRRKRTMKTLVSSKPCSFCSVMFPFIKFRSWLGSALQSVYECTMQIYKKQ